MINNLRIMSEEARKKKKTSNLKSLLKKSTLHAKEMEKVGTANDKSSKPAQAPIATDAE